MPKATKSTQRKAALHRNHCKTAASRNRGKSAVRCLKANGPGAEELKKSQPLKTRHAVPNTEAEPNAATLFATIAERKSKATEDQVKNIDSASDESTPDNHSTDDERVVKVQKLEPANLAEIEYADEVFSQVSSKTSLSSNFRNIDIMNMLKIINDKVDNIGKRQEKCVILAAQANAKIDRLTTRAEQQQSSNAPGKTAELKLVPVNCLADLEAAEEQCEDENFVDSVIREMAQIHGKNRFKTKGGTVCHQTIDYFVDRRFFCRCSWTGISKTIDENQELVPKIAFSRYEKYINLFYKVIRNADDTFTKDECVKFLKLCMRNSKQRANELMLRQPASRNRPKKLPDDFGSRDVYSSASNDHGQSSKSNTEYFEEDQGCSKIEYIDQIIDNDQDEDEDMDELIIEATVLRPTAV